MKETTSKDPLARLAERQTWITPDAQRSTQKAVSDLTDRLGGRKLKEALHGDWLHEPLHAILTDVPIGAWTATIAFDALGTISGRSTFDAAADATIVVGLIGAAGAAITGLNDWSTVQNPAAKRIGAVHGLLNVLAVGLFIGSSIARKGDSRSTGKALAALGYLVVSASAHLGGNLVYEHGIGVSPDRADTHPKLER